MKVPQDKFGNLQLLTNGWGRTLVRSSLKSLSPWQPCNLGPSRFSGGDILRVLAIKIPSGIRHMVRWRRAGVWGRIMYALPQFYRARNLVDQFFNKDQTCRRVATRYDKLAGNNLAFISITAADLLNSVCPFHSHYVSFVISLDLGNEPIGMSAFDPIQNASSCRFERRHIFRKQ